MRTLVILLASVALAGAPAHAAVVDSAAGGFTVRHVVEVRGQAINAYRTLVDRVNVWWQSDHTFSGNSVNLSMDARPGGCFCELLPGRGAVQHLMVVYADAGKLLRLTGGLGPLQDLAVEGTMTWKLTESLSTTTIEMTYRVGGYAPGGLAALAPVVDMVLGTQVGRLKMLIDTGRAQ
jgi:hypothetical protein